MPHYDNRLLTPTLLLTFVSCTTNHTHIAPRWASLQDVPPTPIPATTLAAPAAAEENALEGFNFGVGIGGTFDLHQNKRVREASLDNGFVRIDKDGESEVGLVLETHYFFGKANGGVGLGPFVAVQTGEEDVIDSAALGFMMGIQHSDQTARSFNIGIGVSVDPDARVLADGYSANQPLPSGSTEVRYKEETHFGLIILFSYSF